MSLEGRVAIVTGAGGDMGFAVARQLAEAGASVVLSDVNEDPVERNAEVLNVGRSHPSASAFAADVTREADVMALAEHAGQTFGAVPTILVNNAGLLYPTRVAGISREEWEKVLAVNLTGAFLCSQAVIAGMRREGWGRIVNMSSSAGRSVSTLGGAHYTAAKAGLIGLTRALAKELTESGICVNAVCPGLIDTAMVRGNCPPRQVAAYAQGFPARRLGQPDEVAELVLFLCAHGSYIAGASIDVNGGDLML